MTEIYVDNNLIATLERWSRTWIKKIEIFKGGEGMSPNYINSIIIDGSRGGSIDKAEIISALKKWGVQV